MPRLRSPKEILFRLRQEGANLLYYLKPPNAPVVEMEPLLPSAKEAVEALRNTPYAAQVRLIAEQIMAHKFPILGGVLDTGKEIHWRRDYRSGIETEAKYFRFVPYLDASKTGDHKNIWELSRHQHLVLLAQAGLFSGEKRYWQEITSQLESWWEQNPYGRGINWCSALEVAFRSLSWIWLMQMGRGHLDDTTIKKLRVGLFQHATHLANNLSVYFSPNTHLLGEAVALHAIGALWQGWPQSAAWKATGWRIVAEEMMRQVGEDGAHFEQSTYYHVYALDMFLFHAKLCGTNPYPQKLVKMAEYLESVMGPARRLSFFGDDDGGRFFYPYGRHDEYGRATLAACARYLKADFVHSSEDLMPHAVWLLGKNALVQPASTGARPSRMFPKTGMASLVSKDTHVLMDVGGFGPWSAGHSHADALSITLRQGEEEILVDSGTYTYVGDLGMRNLFRGTGAHNTVRIDGLDQADAMGAFAWSGRPEVKLLAFKATDEEDLVDAECRYRGFCHRRRLQFRKRDGVVLIEDRVEGPAGEHLVEQCWHAGESVELLRPGSYRIGRSVQLHLPGETEFAFDGLRSKAFGEMEHTVVVRVKRKGPLPLVVGAVIAYSGSPQVSVAENRGEVSFTVNGTVFRFGK